MGRHHPRHPALPAFPAFRVPARAKRRSGFVSAAYSVAQKALVLPPGGKYALVDRMSVQSAIQDVWVTVLALQVLLAATLVAKRAWERFPFFVAYSLFNLVECAVTYVVFRYPLTYFYAYVIGETVAIVLGLAVVFEIFRNLFASYPGLRRVAELSLYGVVLVLVLIAGTVLYSHAPIGQNGIVRAVIVMEEAARVVEVGLIAFLFVFYSLFGLHWRQSVFGIALGLGTYTALKLITLTVLPNLKHSEADVVDLVELLGFGSSMLIWLGYMLVPDRITSTGEMPQRAQLEQWNQAIMELINQ